MTAFRHSLTWLFLFTIAGGLLFTACDKDPGTDPQPPENPITGIPALSNVPGSSVSFDAASATYTVTVPAGTDIRALQLNIPLAAGAGISPDPKTTRDYTNPVKYTITANGKTHQVTVKVEVSGSTRSSAKQITAFRFAALSVDAEIDETNRKFTARVPSNTDVTKLTPTITVSDRALVSPASGVQQNFSNPVSYTVLAEDGSYQTYKVSVEKIVGGGRPCLLTRIEVNRIPWDVEYTEYTDFKYNNLGQIISIIDTSNRSDYRNHSKSFEYDTNGDLVLMKSNTYGYYVKLTYQNRRLIKLEEFSSDHQLKEDPIAEGKFKFNEKNELIELKYNSTTETTDGMMLNINVTQKYEYVNGEITKMIQTLYVQETKETATGTIDYEYDNRNSPFAASKPHPLLFLLEIRGLYDGNFYGLRNNLIKVKMQGQGGGKVDDISSKYTFNRNNYPESVDLTSVLDYKKFIRKYYYSNCD